MTIETAILAAVVFGGAAVVMTISIILAKLEDEARRMVRDGHQLHFAGDMG
jgi:hypothetical protein